MKVALLVPGGVDRGGTHRVIPFLLWQIERLARTHELHVFVPHQEPAPSKYPLLGATVHNVGRRPAVPWGVAALLAEHRRARFDVLHAVWAAPCGVIAAVAGRMLRVPVLLHLIGGDLTALPEIGYGVRLTARGRAWLRLAVAGAARITVSTDAMREKARGLGIDAERLPYGVALDRWPPLAPRARPADRPARLLHVASLNRVKDQSTLIGAACVLRDRGIPFTLDIAGEDTLGGRVQALARARGIAGAITFHGFLVHDEVRAMTEQADMLLVSSLHEADPIVALEAAVAGVPVAGTAVGHLSDWAPTAAAAVPTGDAVALAGVIASLLADDARRMDMAAAAQARATAEDADFTAARIDVLYHELVDAGGRA